MWKTTNTRNEDVSIEELRREYPDLVAYDESGFDVDLDDFFNLDADENSRILFWATEEDSENDDGSLAIAEAVRAG